MSEAVSTKIIELENDETLLSFRTHDDIPIYLMAKKYLVFENVMSLVMGIKIAEDDRRINLAAVKFLLKAGMHNISTRTKDKKIVIYVPSRPAIIDGLYFNRYSDLLASEFASETLTIEQTAKDWAWPYPRQTETVIFDGIENAVSTIRGKLSKGKDNQAITEFLSYYNMRLEKILGIKFSESKLQELCAGIAGITEKARLRAEWLDRKVPKNARVLIMVGASYPDSYPITKRLKDRGVVVADLQHGFITKTNPVYSYAPAIENHADVKAGSADYFLTYGNWWNDQILNPSQKVAIGNPYRDFLISRVKADIGKRIVVIGSGLDTEEKIKLAETLQKKFSEYKVVFRPHPGEIEMAKRIISEKGYGLVQLDEIKEIYESLSVTETIISEMSTVLFEAIGICKNIITLDTEYTRHNLPDNPFIKCKTDEEVVSVLQECEAGGREIDYSIEDMWKSGWKDNYHDFISSIM